MRRKKAREILFRGMTKSGEWIYGYYCNCIRDVNAGDIYPVIQQINDNDLYLQEVIPETVGQYTGLIDENDKKVFEGDIVTFKNKDEKLVGEVEQTNCRYGIRSRYISYSLANIKLKDGEVTVIGNIYEDPELLEENL